MKNFFILTILAITCNFVTTSCAQDAFGGGFIPSAILEGKVSHPEQIQTGRDKNHTVWADLTQDGMVDMFLYPGGGWVLDDRYTSLIFDVIVGTQGDRPVWQKMEVIVPKDDLASYKYSNRFYQLEKSVAPLGGKGTPIYVGERTDPVNGINYSAYRLAQNFVMVRLR